MSAKRLCPQCPTRWHCLPHSSLSVDNSFLTTSSTAARTRLAPTSPERGKEETWCLTSTETVRLIRDGEKGGGGMEVEEEGDYIPIGTLSPSE